MSSRFNIIKILSLLIVIILAINLFLTIPLTINKTNIANSIREKLSLLNYIGINYQLEIDTSYKFNKIELEEEIGYLNNINSEIDKIIEYEKNDINIKNNILINDFTFLKSQINKLDNTNYELINNDKDDIKSLFDYSEYIDQEINSIKNEIEEIKLMKVKKNEFVNPLWGFTYSELENKLNNMSIEEKAGQLFMYSIGGYSLSKKEIDNLTKYSPSGVILMGYNISNEAQLKELTKQIQNTNNSIPYFISTDQEGGVVKRIYWDNTEGQKNWEKYTDEQICDIGKNRSNTLLSSGINVNFSPVVDLSIKDGGYINNRTISNNANIVSEKAKIYIECSLNTGINTTLKHYPGHGMTKEDSHYVLPSINKSKQDWLNSDAKPFMENINSPFIMVGHLKMTSIDNNPASLSKVLIKDILFDEFKYTGIVITDDMNQLHRSTKISYKEAIIKSINAGTDIILYVGMPLSPVEAINIIKEGVVNNEISMEEIDNSVIKILKVKANLL